MKLPEWITNRLGWITTKARSIMWRYPSFSNFADFSAEEAEIECDPNISLTFAQYAPERDAKLKTNRFGANVLLVSTHSEDKFSSGLCQLCQQKDRSLQNCRTFSGKDMSKKKRFFQEFKVCFAYLGKWHISNRCLERSATMLQTMIPHLPSYGSDPKCQSRRGTKSYDKRFTMGK